jgi:hypothetical protein
MNALVCRNEQRRETVRQRQDLNGLDYLEVGTDRQTLIVYFLGKAPVSLDPSNIVIDGGRRIRDIKIKEIKVTHNEMVELDDFMEVITNKEGDFSNYTLRIVDGRDEAGNWRPHSSFDPRYDRVDFSFKVDCPSDLDCVQENSCPPEKFEEPEINYLAKDYASFRQLMLDRLALVMPDWRERHVPDLGITLVELLAYLGDHLSYYQDAVATEAYLETARKRISVRRHARLVDYPMHEGCNARTWVCVETDSDIPSLDPKDTYFVTRIDSYARVVEEKELQNGNANSYEVFEAVSDEKIWLYAGEHEIGIYTWGDQECCLPVGATTATLIGKWVGPSMPEEPTDCDPDETRTSVVTTATSDGQELHLKRGDVLIFEEVIGAKTGNPADADPKHRQAIRLTAVHPGYDPLNPNRALTEIVWAEEDALRFPLCLSARGPAPDCKVIENISVARGNLILVDHGLTIEEDLDPIPIKETIEECDCNGALKDTILIPDRYQPILKKGPQTFRQSVETSMPVQQTLSQDPRQALPQVKLVDSMSGEEASHWIAKRDLLSSGSRDQHFVVELDESGRAQLRFGDDELGKRPHVGSVFHAVYRIGNGPAGNVGAGTISHLVTRNTHLSVEIRNIRNPLPASGGTAPELLAEVKLFAPHVFRKRLERAITAKDYADIVLREFPGKIQRAAANLLWNGSWYEMLVVVDPLGQEEAGAELLGEIESRLYRYRRIGHDLIVRSAKCVPLDIEILVCVLPGYLRAHVKVALQSIFSNRMFSDGKFGFFHPDNLTFGEGIYLSQIVAAAQSIIGVESVSVTKLQRLYELPNGELENGVLPLSSFEIARADNDPSVPENGRVKIDVRGGR